jgi:hypothetical protein
MGPCLPGIKTPVLQPVSSQMTDYYYYYYYFQVSLYFVRTLPIFCCLKWAYTNMKIKMQRLNVIRFVAFRRLVLFWFSSQMVLLTEGREHSYLKTGTRKIAKTSRSAVYNLYCFQILNRCSLRLCNWSSG